MADCLFFFFTSFFYFSATVHCTVSPYFRLFFNFRLFLSFLFFLFLWFISLYLRILNLLLCVAASSSFFIISLLFLVFLFLNNFSIGVHRLILRDKWPSLLSDGEKGIKIVCNEDKIFCTEQPRLNKNLLYRHDKPNERTKEGPLPFVLFESPFSAYFLFYSSFLISPKLSFSYFVCFLSNFSRGPAEKIHILKKFKKFTIWNVYLKPVIGKLMQYGRVA